MYNRMALSVFPIFLDQRSEENAFFWELNCIHPKTHVETLTPSTPEGALLGNRVVADVIH